MGEHDDAGSVIAQRADVTLLDEVPVVLVTRTSCFGKSTVGELLGRRFIRGVHV